MPWRTLPLRGSATGHGAPEALVSTIRGGAAVAAKEGYCVKCKAKREIKDAQEITMKNGRPATQGVCPVCGTKIFKIGK